MKIKTSDVVLGVGVLGALYLGYSALSAGTRKLDETNLQPQINIPQLLPNITLPNISLFSGAPTQAAQQAAQVANNAAGFAADAWKSSITDLMSGYSPNPYIAAVQKSPAVQQAAASGITTALTTGIGLGASSYFSGLFNPQVVGSVTPVASTTSSQKAVSGQTKPSVLYSLAGVSTAAPFSQSSTAPTSTVSTPSANTTQSNIVKTLTATAISAPKGSSGVTNVPYGTVGTGVNAGYVATGSGVWRKIQV